MIMEKNYILSVITEYCLCGDSYIDIGKLFKLCRKKFDELTHEDFGKELIRESEAELIYIDGVRVYSYLIWRYECNTAQKLSIRLANNCFPNNCTIKEFTFLSNDQKKALFIALSNRISMILGGAGSGKTTLIRAIVESAVESGDYVLCAPTGKAARNLTDRTGLTARTVHSVLGKAPNDDFLISVVWEHTKLVIVDEASMLTLEMLSGILSRINGDCRLVLVGDPNQLPSVGAGNVIEDLIKIGVPYYSLTENYRLCDDKSGLANNVVNFPAINAASQLVEDESFKITETNDAESLAIAEAVKRYTNGESLLVVSPFRKNVNDMNEKIRDILNPVCEAKRILCFGGKEFREDDKVMITENDRQFDVVNGDIGTFHILSDNDDLPSFCVSMPGGRIARWDFPLSIVGLNKITLAYALTVHKSQGSQYDTVIMPLSMDMNMMLNRNLFYTAISRARKQVLIYGSRQAVETSIKHSLPNRKSALAEKVYDLQARIA